MVMLVYQRVSGYQRTQKTHGYFDAPKHRSSSSSSSLPRAKAFNLSVVLQTGDRKTAITSDHPAFCRRKPVERCVYRLYICIHVCMYANLYIYIYIYIS